MPSPASSDVFRGKSAPLGATVYPDGVNFSVYSKHATHMELLLFDGVDAPEASRVIALDPDKHRSFHYWHVFVRGLRPGQVYAYRAHGPNVPDMGLRFDAEKILLDPYGRLVAIPAAYEREAASRPGSNQREGMKSVVVDTASYDWEGDAPLCRPFVRTVIYEMHVGGFTKHPSAGVSPERQGTYAGLIEKIPYLKELGVTAVELLPVYQFDSEDAPTGRTNYWGYAPISFFAPHGAYSSRRDLFGPLDEFRDMVKALHRAGIEVILDVVYNHTSEGTALGPTFCYRGLDNVSYYLLDDHFQYANYSGTGNTLNAQHSVVRRMIMDSLRYWVREMHVDGFRFDLASIFARDRRGHPLEDPEILLSIETDPELVDTKLIAEPWDAAGLYQVGSFIGDRWKEWNGRFRDDIRAFVKGDDGMVSVLANRLLASPDIYAHEQREPEQSINFVTCHDGFTLYDLVSYNHKHNEANGEGNRDGLDHNLSWNCGVEGPTGDPEILALRKRQAKNFILLTMLALGVPMVLMGDEMCRTQRGNNNAYAQDNELSWLDWSRLAQHGDVQRFLKLLIRWRLHYAASRDEDVTLNETLRKSRYEWHGVRLDAPDWGPTSHSLAFMVRSRSGHVYAAFNAYWEPLDFELPAPPDGAWRRFVDTFRSAPEDIAPPEDAPAITDRAYRLGPRSDIVLID